MSVFRFPLILDSERKRMKTGPNSTANELSRSSNSADEVKGSIRIRCPCRNEREKSEIKLMTWKRVIGSVRDKKQLLEKIPDKCGETLLNVPHQQGHSTNRHHICPHGSSFTVATNGYPTDKNWVS